MRSMLVAPGVPKRTPAMMMMRWPAAAKPSRKAMPAGALDHVVEVARVLGDDACTPQTSASRRAVRDVRRDRQDRRVAAARARCAGRSSRRRSRHTIARGRASRRPGARRPRSRRRRSLPARRAARDDRAVDRVALHLLGDPVHRRDRLDRDIARRRSRPTASRRPRPRTPRSRRRRPRRGSAPAR